MFKPAERQSGKLRMACIGPAKSGKTLSAMRIMNALVGPDQKWCVFDTENGSASKYSGYGGFQFDHCIPEDHSPKTFKKAIVEAYKGGYAGLIIDSLSHEWVGKGGCLETVNTLASQDRNKNSYVQWAHVTPAHNELFEIMNRAPIHIICTLRVKMGYELQKNDNGKVVPVKMGLEPITRDGVVYEFDVLMEMEGSVGTIEASRCPQVCGRFEQPGEDVAEILRAWLEGKLPATTLFPMALLSIPDAVIAEPSMDSPSVSAKVSK